MFKIITTSGVQLGLTEEVHYIKQSRSKTCFVQATKEDAVGIVFNNKQYNLRGHTEIPKADTVFIREFNGGKLVEELTEENANLKKQLEDADEALIELYELLGGR